MHLPRLSRRLLTVTAVAPLTAASLVACGGDDDPGAGDGGAGAGDGLEIVASTDIYGSVAEAVVGDAAEVTSIVDSPAVDPHSFEASPADAASIADADLVVYNGAGYDMYIDQALSTTEGVPTVVATEEFEGVTGLHVEGHDHGDEDGDHGDHDHGGHESHDHGSDEHAGHTDGHGDHEHGEHAGDHGHAPAGTTQNEHVWMSLPTMSAVAESVAEEMAALDPDNAATYEENAATFSREVDTLFDDLLADVAEHHAEGREFLQSEDIGGHLFSDLGLVDATPEGFLAAIHANSDPSARDFDEVLTHITDGDVAFFAYNEQTATDVTDRLLEAAEQSGLPVIVLTETLPEGEDYLSMVAGVVEDASAALGA